MIQSLILRLSVLIVIAVSPTLATEIVGYVVDSHGKPIAGAQVKVVGIGSDTSTSTGEFHVAVSASMVGHRVVIRVFKDGWALRSSTMLVIVPANGAQDPIRIELAKLSSPLANAHEEGLDADFSAFVPDETKEPDLFRVSYRAKSVAAGIDIAPDVPYLNLLNKGGPISPVHYYWTPFKISLPELDIKVVNNTGKTIFFTKAEFLIDDSHLDASPILLMGGRGYEMQMAILNLGWGPIHDARLRFDLIPEHRDKDPDLEGLFAKGQDFHNAIAVTENESVIRVDFASALASLGVDVDTIKNRPIESTYFENSTTYVFKDKNGNVTKMNEQQYRERLKKAYGPFVTGSALFIGELSYADPSNPSKRKSLKLVNQIVFGEPGVGAPRPPSFRYNVKFEVEGRNYTQEVALAQELKPQEADRFTIRIAADKSSFHRFKLRLIYNNGKVITSPPITLGLFMPQDVERYLQEDNINMGRSDEDE